MQPYFDKFIDWVDNLTSKFEALSPEAKKQIGQFILLGAVGLVAAGALYTFGGVVIGLTTLASPLTLKLLALAVALDTIYRISSALARLPGIGLAGIGKGLGHVPGLEKLINIGSKKAGGAGQYSFKTWEETGRRMESGNQKGFDEGLIGAAKNLIGGLDNSLFGGVVPGGGAAAINNSITGGRSLIGGVPPLPSIPLGSNRAVSQSGQNINLNITVDTASQALEFMKDSFADQGID